MNRTKIQNMLARAVLSLMVTMLILHQVVGQTVPTNAGNKSVTLTTETTCGVDSSDCPTYQTPVPNAMLDSGDIPSSAVPEESTSVSTQERNFTHSATSLLENETKHTETSTPKQQKASSTPAPTPPPSRPVARKLPEEEIAKYANSGACACDLMAYTCDINCCCDPECTALQRLSFSECKADGYTPYDNRYCFATKLIFLNNTELTLQQIQNSAFCIVRANLAGSILYPPLSAYSTYLDFDKHWVRSHSSSWPELSVRSLFSFEKPVPYKAGDSLWILQNSHIRPLEFPSHRLSGACSTARPVQYLLPWSSKCIQKAPYTQSECANVSSYFDHQVENIIRSPPLVNQTQLTSGNTEPCASSVCVPVTYFSCEGSAVLGNLRNICKKIPNKKLLFRYKPDVCYNVVKRLKLVLHHNGTAGIVNAEAYFWLSNMTLSEGSVVKSFHQSISVEFIWQEQNETAMQSTNKNNTASHALNFTSEVNLAPYARSGNPGYIVGKPVIAGFRVKQISGMNTSKDATMGSNMLMKNDMIELSHDPKQWLTLPGSALNGMCDWSEDKRHVVTFGEDMHISCGVTVLLQNISTSASCNSLRTRMLHLLLGDGYRSFQNISLQSDWGRVIAAYGSANVSMPQDWVPFLLDNQSPFSLMQMLVPTDSKTSLQEDMDRPLQKCENVPLGIQVRIMYGLVGTTTNPQSRILGASLRFSPLQDIGKTCISETCFQKSKSSLYLRVLCTVKFMDATSPAVTRFAEPPAIHIRLPPDFFYPFMAAADSASDSIQCVPLLLILFSSFLAYVISH